MLLTLTLTPKKPKMDHVDSVCIHTNTHTHAHTAARIEDGTIITFKALDFHKNLLELIS